MSLSLLNLATPVAQASEAGIDKFQTIIQQLIEWGIDAGGRIIGAVLIYIIGRIIICVVKKVLNRILVKRKVDSGVFSFVNSLVGILLNILLAIAIIGKLGIETTSFAALLASAGVAVGMALSGNLQNFAGGLVILVLRPLKVGDFIEAQGVSGTVTEVQIFHTILTTPDNKVIYVPNGTLSSGTVINYSKKDTRRLDWTVCVEYGSDYEKVKSVLNRLIAADNRILKTPEPFIALNNLADSSVNLVVRAWVNAADYWDVNFDMNKVIYAEFNKEGIKFPFPQLTLHQA